jgi:hypothetical protein
VHHLYELLAHVPSAHVLLRHHHPPSYTSLRPLLLLQMDPLGMAAGGWRREVVVAVARVAQVATWLGQARSGVPGLQRGVASLAARMSMAHFHNVARPVRRRICSAGLARAHLHPLTIFHDLADVVLLEGPSASAVGGRL